MPILLGRRSFLKGAAAAAAGFALEGVTTTANTNYLTKSGTGMGAASDDMAVSFWFKRTTTGSETVYRSDAAGRWECLFTSGNVLRCAWNNNTGGSRLLLDTTSTYTDTNWHHVMAAWHNTTSTGGAASGELYVDGSDEMNEAANTIGSAQFEPQARSHHIGHEFTGDIAQMWVDDANVDLTDAPTRAKFYDSGAVDFGSDGSTPTGTQPFLYMPYVSGSLLVNAGSAGDFSQTGTVTSSSTSPTD